MFGRPIVRLLSLPGGSVVWAGPKFVRPHRGGYWVKVEVLRSKVPIVIQSFTVHQKSKAALACFKKQNPEGEPVPVWEMSTCDPNGSSWPIFDEFRLICEFWLSVICPGVWSRVFQFSLACHTNKTIHTLTTARIIIESLSGKGADRWYKRCGGGNKKATSLVLWYYARVRQHYVAPNGKVRNIVREETAESTSCEPSHGQGWLSKPGVGLSHCLLSSCGNRARYLCAHTCGEFTGRQGLRGSQTWLQVHCKFVVGEGWLLRVGGGQHRRRRPQNNGGVRRGSTDVSKGAKLDMFDTIAFKSVGVTPRCTLGRYPKVFMPPSHVCVCVCVCVTLFNHNKFVCVTLFYPTDIGKSLQLQGLVSLKAGQGARTHEMDRQRSTCLLSCFPFPFPPFFFLLFFSFVCLLL